MVHYIVTTSGFSFFNFLLIDENQANKQFSQENCILGTAPNKYGGGGGKAQLVSRGGTLVKNFAYFKRVMVVAIRFEAYSRGENSQRKRRMTNITPDGKLSVTLAISQIF